MPTATPIKPDKGKYDGSCNRTACQKPGAKWFNKGTKRYYCAPCADAINEASHDMLGEALCVLEERAPMTASQ